MIPILYKENETDFSTYGIGALSDTISCEVTEERNGAYECIMKYPVTGEFYSEIRKERLIKAKPNDTSMNQAFRIYRITKPLNGIITIYAQHISYDLSTIATPPWSADGITPQVAIDHSFDTALTPHRFTFRTDYTLPKNFSINKPKSLRAVLGGSAGSLISLWGGEFEWDNFNVIHHQGRGKSTGVIIEYGKNLTELEQDSDTTEIYTDLLPYATTTDINGNEQTITLTEQILPITETTLFQRKTLIKDFTDNFAMNEIITEASLREKAERYIANNPLGIENPELKISFEPLWKQPEYISELEHVSLCDRVIIRHLSLGVDVSAKIVKTKYDTLGERFISITLGSVRSNLIDAVSDTQASIERTSNRVDQLPSIMNTAILNATNLITGQKGGYVIMHTDTRTGQPYELLILDAPSIEDSVNVWRWNVGGLGFSANGYNGPYETAITADGQIVANFITAGELQANIIKAGILQSADGETFVLDLDKGTFTMNATGKFSSPDKNACIEINSQEIVLYVRDTQGRLLDKIRIGSMRGYDQVDYPYILMGNLDTGDVGLMKKFQNGMWYGNSVPKDAVGNFSGMTGASGIFINTIENKAYVVAGTEMQNVYTGEAIARFA